MERLRDLGRLLAELWLFAARNRAWWLVPTVILLLLLGLVVFAGQAVAPFVYTLF
jgi:hypothetical protein